MAVLARRTPGRRARRAMSDINVVPYVDVMLVLVVILMISAPFVNPSLVELPSVGKTTRAPDAPMEVIVLANGNLILRDRSTGGADQPVDLPALVGAVKNKQAKSPDTPVVISADKNVRYEQVTRVMDALYKENVRRVGLAVKPAT
jgi:biopolymer transport protein TolR